MRFFSEAQGLLRFALGIETFLAETVSVADARETIRRRMHDRDRAFLEIIERAVFANRRSPYLQLLRHAGCELGDLKRLVAREGIEGALRILLDAGVYVSFDELKGRTPAVRGSRSFEFRDTDFDNRRIRGHFATRTGGSGGRSTRVTIDLDYLADRAPIWAVWFAAHGIASAPLVFVTPFHAGMVNLQLICARFGNRFVQWFATASGGSLAYRLVSRVLHSLVQRSGFPAAAFLRGSELGAVAEYLSRMSEAGVEPAVNTSPSQAIRLCTAAATLGRSLAGVTFLLGYEPLTPLRRRAIEASGAAVTMTYGFSEGGTIGQQCPQATHADDVHVAADAFAVVSRRREVGGGETVDALALTALLPTSPKVLVNAEIGDCAITETRACRCPLDDLGYTGHLHTIRSFEKLTGLGVTFAGADLFRVFDEALPRRFGGAPTDYQLLEEQDARGVARYTLRVSPEVGELDEGVLLATFLDELGRMRRPYGVMTNLWASAGAVRVKRQRPLATPAGKLLPFRTIGVGHPSSAGVGTDVE